MSEERHVDAHRVREALARLAAQPERYPPREPEVHGFSAVQPCPCGDI